MCNYSDAILRLGEEKGRAAGMAAGRAEGIAAGRAEGKMETLTDLVRKNILSVKDAAAQADMTIGICGGGGTCEDTQPFCSA